MACGPWRGPALPGARRALARAWTALMLGVLGVLASAPARAQVAPISLNLLQAVRGDDGVWVSFDVNLRLTPAVEEALSKGVALYFVADARLVRYRWYWSDEVARWYPRGRRDPDLALLKFTPSSAAIWLPTDGAQPQLYGLDDYRAPPRDIHAEIRL